MFRRTRAVFVQHDFFFDRQINLSLIDRFCFRTDHCEQTQRAKRVLGQLMISSPGDFNVLGYKNRTLAIMPPSPHTPNP